jgi:predicted TIM-barrel fold metal-dependent hydrolase
MNLIDAHCHVWTPDTVKYPLTAGYRRAQMDPPSFTVDELRAQMQPLGINRVVLIQMSFYGYDNSYMLDAIAAHPAAFRGVAVVEQDRGDPSGAMRQLQQKGCTGFRIYPKDRDYENWLSSDTMQTMWRVAGEQQLNICCLMDTNGLPALAEMCRRFPDTPVVIDHMCRIGVTGEISAADVQSLCNLAPQRQVTVKISAFYALGQKQPPYTDLGPLIHKLLEAFGPERLMWASDGPFQMQVPHSYRASLELMQSGLDFLTVSDKDWLLRKTAERVFFPKS